MKKRRVALPVSNLGWLWLVGGLALVIAPHLLRLPIWLSLLCVGAMAWRVARDRKGWPLPGMAVRVTFTLLGIAAVVSAYHTILGQDAGVALLAVMLSLKLMEMETLRDAMVVILLAYFMVAAGFLFDQSLFAGVYLFGTVVVITAALMVINHPAARPDLTRDYLRRSITLLLQALPLMAVLFVLFPRAQGLGWGITTPKASAQTGLSDSMNIGDVTDLTNSREVAFRVEFSTPPPPTAEWYWRGPVLWRTDGRRWTTLSANELRAAGPPAPFTPQSGALDYIVTLQPGTTSRWLPALEIPALVPDSSVVTADLQIFSLRRVDQTRRYSMRSYPRFKWQGLTPKLRAEALALPSSNPRAQQLGREWQVSYPSAGQRVKQAIRYFTESPFYYTRHPATLGADPVDQFLFEERRGFCEHYAAAFVVLMRAAGVPSRVVTGYQGGEWNNVGNYWVVRQSDAHAWAEVYLEEQGWVRVDPTAALPPGRIEADTLPPDIEADGVTLKPLPWSGQAWRWAGQSWDTVNFQWNRWIAGYSQERQRELLSQLGLRSENLLALALTLASAAVLAVGGALFFSWQGTQERDPAARLYRRFCDKLARAGIARNQNESEQEYANRVAMVRPELAGQVHAITDVYQRLRYGRPSVAPALRQLREAVSAFKP